MVGAGQVVERAIAYLAHRALDAPECRPRRGGHVEAKRAPVGGVRAPFDMAGLDQLVEYADQRHRRDVEECRELDLPQARFARETEQGLRLRERHAVVLRAAVELRAHQAHDIAQQEAYRFVGVGHRKPGI